MNNLQIDNKDFNSAKAKLKQFSDNIPQNPTLVKFKEDTLWGVLSKNVTGKDMNEFVKEIQSILISGNETTKNIIAEFKAIYDTFDALDKNYIQAILHSIERSEKANNEALKAQEYTEKTIETLKLTVQKLAEFKNESVKEIDLLKNKINTFQTTLNNSLHSLQCIDALKSQLEEQKHLNDIDSMWKGVQVNKEELSKVNNNLNVLSTKNNELDNKLSTDIKILHDQMDYKAQQFNSKLKIAYALIGCMIIALAVHIFLNLLQVI